MEEETVPVVDKDNKEGGISKTLKILVIILAVLVLAGLGAWIFISGTSKTVAKTVKVESEIPVLRIAMKQNFTEDISPVLSLGTNSSINRNVFDSLVYSDSIGAIRPYLAVSWVNPDSTTWIFTMRKNVKYSDGTDFKPEDFIKTWEKIKVGDPEVSELRGYFDDIASMTVTTDGKIVMKTTQPVPYLLGKIQYLQVVKPATLDKDPVDMIGTGAFKFNTTETVVDGKLVLDRNNLYWGEAPKVAKVIAYTYDEDAPRVEGYNKGDLDIIALADTEEAKNITASGKLYNMADNGIALMQLNQADSIEKFISKTPNPMKDLNVRKAIWQAIDTSKLVQDFPGIAATGNQVIARSIFGYSPLVRPAYNVETAKALMKEAGYEDGFTVTLKWVSPRRPILDFIKESLAKINITVNVETIDPNNYGDYLDELSTGQFGMGMAVWVEETRDAQNTIEAIFKTDGYANFAKYSNPTLDLMVKELNNLTDQKQRLAKLQEIMKLAYDDVAVIPLYAKSTELFYDVNKVNWQQRSDGDISFIDASGWTTKTVEEKQDGFLSIFGL